MKINKKHLILEYHESENSFPVPFGHIHWTGPDGVYVNRIYVLRWKSEYNPHSNDENSPTRDIAYISFHEDTPNISHVYMKPKYRGSGLGKLLYSWVTKEEGYLTTDFNYASDMAQRVWRSLFKVFPTRKLGNTYRIYPA